MKKDSLICNFCGKNSEDVNNMFAGPNNTVFICDFCIELCKNLPKKVLATEEGALSLEQLPTPIELKEKLDKYIIGQENSKRVLSVAVYNHYKRIHHNVHKTESETELNKSNVLMVGATGTGKTLMAKTLARVLNVPFVITDATTLTEAGYVGEDVENILLRLLQNCDYNQAKAELGIIYIDEIDKIARTRGNLSITRDVSGEGVQQALLKIIEGTEASVNPQGGRKHPQQETIKINTENILFICGGAFDGIEKIIANRSENNGIGFTMDVKKPSKSVNSIQKIEPEDLVTFGLIPEFVGRLPIITSLDLLDEDSLVRILLEPHNSLIKQYRTLLGFDNVGLEVRKDALKEMAKIAIERKTGARGLRSIVEKVLQDVLYKVPSRSDIDKVIIDSQVVRGEKPVIYKIKKQLLSGTDD